MNANDIKTKAGAFVCQYLNNAEVDPSLDLFSSGMVNSLFAMQLVLFVEKEFGVAVQNEDLDYENFKSIDAIAEFVGKKLGVAA
ncbi:MAG TPA: acyl carrier protein [Rhodocyclaceae bacterium]|nr:acyl carrier protein [Rhodocyclaceae bacterium]